MRNAKAFLTPSNRFRPRLGRTGQFIYNAVRCYLKETPLADGVLRVDASSGKSTATPEVIFFVGDSITLGWGDEDVGGWPARLISGLARQWPVTAYNLGVRSDTSTEIVARWYDEVRRRKRAARSALIVFAFGANDAKLDRAGRLVTPIGATRRNTAESLALATREHQVLLVGPAPVDEKAIARAINPTGDVAVPTNRQIAAVSSTLADEAATAGVAYLDLVERLADDQVWHAALRETDGIHPPGRGHDMIARLVANWRPWASLFA
jgi:acyl-CoA thioesterase I